MTSSVSPVCPGNVLHLCPVVDPSLFKAARAASGGLAL